MKCPHCTGGVVELFITSKQCERCDGRGNLEAIEAKGAIVFDTGHTVALKGEEAAPLNPWVSMAWHCDEAPGFTYEKLRELHLGAIDLCSPPECRKVLLTGRRTGKTAAALREARTFEEPKDF